MHYADLIFVSANSTLGNNECIEVQHLTLHAAKVHYMSLAFQIRERTNARYFTKKVKDSKVGIKIQVLYSAQP